MTTNWLRTSGDSQSHASMMAIRLAEFSGTDGAQLSRTELYIGCDSGVRAYGDSTS